MRLDRVGAFEARFGEPIDQFDGIVGTPYAQLDCHLQQPSGRTEPRQQRGGRGDHDPNVAPGERHQGPGAGGSDVEVRGDAAIRIDLGRRKRQDGAGRVFPGEALECREEEPRVAGHRLDVAIARHHQHDRSGAGIDRACERLRRRRQPGERVTGGRTTPQSGALGRRPKEGAQRQRHVMLQRPSGARKPPSLPGTGRFSPEDCRAAYTPSGGGSNTRRSSGSDR